MWEIKLEVRSDQVDLVDDFLAETGAEGWNLYSEAFQPVAVLTGYFEDETAARAAWEALRGEWPSGLTLPEPDYRAVEDQDWKDAYKEHFHAWRFGRLHWVPVWEKESFQLPEGDDVVWLDPGMAFGTGNHETTRLCVERMIACADQWRAQGRDLEKVEVIDAGCGSGILAISAVKCGFGKVAGFDNDPVAVDVSEENAQLNDVGGRIEFYEGDLVTGLAGRTADLVIANILANVLCEYVRELVMAVKPGGRLVLSGILATEVENVRKVFAEAMPEAVVSSRELGEWADVLAELPDASYRSS